MQVNWDWNWEFLQYNHENEGESNTETEMLFHPEFIADDLYFIPADLFQNVLFQVRRSRMKKCLYVWNN